MVKKVLLTIVIISLYSLLFVFGSSQEAPNVLIFYVINLSFKITAVHDFQNLCFCGSEMHWEQANHVEDKYT